MPVFTGKIISNPMLGELDRALSRLRRHPIDGPMIDRFGYDHGNTLLYDTFGKCDLLIENDTDVKRDCARLLLHCSPAMMRELWRGYTIAKEAGLLALSSTKQQDGGETKQESYDVWAPSEDAMNRSST